MTHTIILRRQLSAEGEWPNCSQLQDLNFDHQWPVFEQSFELPTPPKEGQRIWIEVDGQSKLIELFAMHWHPQRNAYVQEIQNHVVSLREFRSAFRAYSQLEWISVEPRHKRSHQTDLQYEADNIYADKRLIEDLEVPLHQINEVG